MKTRTRFLAMLLSVLMIAGLLPFSVFAVGNSGISGSGPVSDEKYEGEKWQSPDLETLVNAFYPDINNPLNSTHWTRLYAKPFSEVMSTGSASDEQGFKGPNGKLTIRNVGQNAANQNKNITVVQSGADKGALYFGIAPNGSGATDYLYLSTFEIWSPTDSKNGAIPVLANNGYAGRDFMFSFDYKPETIAEDFDFVEFTERYTYTDASGNVQTVSPQGNIALRIKKDADGKIGLYFKANDVRICDLSTEEYTNIKVLVDVGGPTAQTAANTVYVFINGVLKGSSAFITNYNIIDQLYRLNNTAGQPDGFLFCEARVWRGDYKKNSAYINNAQTFYFNPVEGREYESVYGYYDLNEGEAGTAHSWHQRIFLKSGTNVGIDGDAVMLKSALAVSGTNMYFRTMNNNYKIVSDDNGGNAIQLDPANDGKEAYIELGNSQSKNGNKENAGRDFVISMDIKLGKNITAGFAFQSYIRRMNGSNIGGPNFFVFDSNGTLKLGGAGSSESQNRVIGQLNKGSFTNLAIRVDTSENLFYAYVNGVCVNPSGDKYMGDSQYQACLEDFGALTFCAARIHHHGPNTAGLKTPEQEIYDNLIVYFSSDFIGENTSPLKGAVKGDDGYIYYYENGIIVPNATGNVTTDETGAIIKKIRTPFIDWDATAAASSRITNIKDFAGSTSDGQKQLYAYVNDYIGSASALHIWTDMSNLSGGSGNTQFKIKEELKEEKTLYFNPGKGGSGSQASANGAYNYKTAKYLDISKYDAFEMDFYTDGAEELVGLLMFSCESDMYGITAGKSVNMSSYFNFGTKSDYGTGYNSSGASQSLSSIRNALRYSGWSTYNLDLSKLDWGRSGETKYPVDADNGLNGGDLDDRQFVNIFEIYTKGWSHLDYKYADATKTALVLNGTDMKVYIKDMYLVNYEKITSLNDIFESVNNDWVPKNEAACFNGIYTAESGNVYYYSAENHSRVVNKAAYDTMQVAEVTGYSFDSTGLATPLNGVYKVQTGRTHMYVDGVKQVGTAADNFRVNVGGVDYRINAEGDYMGYYFMTEFMEGFPTDYTYTQNGTDANGKATNNFFFTDFGTGADQQLLNFMENVQPTYASHLNLQNGGKLNMGVHIADYNNGDNALAVRWHNNTRDSYVEIGLSQNGHEGMNTVTEFDVKLGSDWNSKVNIQFISRKEGSYGNSLGTEFGDTFGIDANGMLYDKKNGGRCIYQLSPSEFTKLAFVARHVRVADHADHADWKYYDLYIDVYANGVKVSSDTAVYRDKQYKRIESIRLFALSTNAAQHDTGTLYVDNIACYYGDGIVPQYVSDKTLNGIVGGKYYDNGNLVTGREIEAGDALYVADANGWLAFNSGKTLVNGKYYNFVGYEGEIYQGIIEGKYYNNGVLLTGIIDSSVLPTLKNGQIYVADDNGNLQHQNERNVTVNGKIYDFDSEYLGTERDGLIVYNRGTADEEAFFYADGVIIKTVIDSSMAPELGADQIYYPDSETGKLLKDDGDGYTAIGDMLYNFVDYVGTPLRNAEVDGKYYDADGHIVVGQDIILDGGKIYSADGEGNLIANGIYQAHNGLWYTFGADYVGTICNGVVKNAFEGAAITARYFVDGVAQTGFVYPDGSGKYYYAEANGDLVAGKHEIDGKTYDFSEDYYGQLRTGLVIIEDLYWSDGVPADGVFMFNKGSETVERLFRNGVPSAGRVPDSSGSVYDYGADGYRVTDTEGEPVSKTPHEITIILRQDGEKDIVKKFYNFDGMPFKYVPIYRDCMTYIITDGDGNVVDEIDIDSVTEALEFVITYDSSKKVHVPVVDENVDSTCTTKGYISYVCALCGEKLPGYTEEKPLVEHKFNATQTKAPTCFAKGVMTYKCIWCDTSYTEDIPMIAHTWNDGVVTTPAGCGSDGVKTYTCTVNGCGATKTESIFATGAHAWVMGETVESTCKIHGYIPYTCSACNLVKKIELPLAYHTYDPSDVCTIKTIATPDKPGTLLYDCAVCGEKEIVAVEYGLVINEAELREAVIKGGYIALGGDIELSEELYLNNVPGLVIDGNGYKITAAAGFAMNIEAQYQLVKIITPNLVTLRNITLEHISLDQTDKFYHTLDIVDSEVVLENVTIIRAFDSEKGGAAVVLNSSKADVKGEFNINVSGSSWGGVNVDNSVLDITQGNVTFDGGELPIAWTENNGEVKYLPEQNFKKVEGTNNEYSIFPKDEE